MKIKLSVFFIFSFFSSFSQSSKYRVISVPVQKNGIWLRDPWVGGMDSPQFSMGDLNQDGIPDLFVFDRSGDRVITYLGNGGAPDTMFTYAPQYESVFTTSLSNWALLRDYNHDGIPDIFAFNQLGIAVLKGSMNGNVIHFDTVSNSLRYFWLPGSPRPNLQLYSLDIPGIIDVNGDGDLDILAYQYGTTVVYYENQTVEHPGDPAYAYDSLKYNLSASCWGNFAQNPLNNSERLDIGPTGCIFGDSPYIAPPVGGLQRHDGNSLYPIVDPVTGYIDLLNGNIGYNTLMFLRNDSARSYPFGNMYLWDSLFPPSPCANPINQFYYPAGFGVNISSDNYEDLLVSPCVIAPYIYGGGFAHNVNNVLWYKNLRDSTCYYQYMGDSFLVHHMLDFGTNSRGVFYDFDGDGLMDIIVGSFGYFDTTFVDTTFLPQYYRATLAYYRNVGTATQPKFQEITSDYNNFSSFHLYGTSPAFGDLNGDGKPDLVIGDNSGYLYYFINTATTGSNYPVMTASHFDNLKVSAFAAPFIYDVDGDSLNDLLVGADDGYIHFFKNIGTKTSPLFSESVQDSFGQVNVCASQTYNSCFAQPFVMKDDSGRLILYVGSGPGLIAEYIINPSKPDTAFQLVNGSIMGRRIAANATISIADINDDGKLEYLLGTSTGGLMLYSDSLWDSTTLPLANNEVPPANPSMQIFPNPVRDYFICKTDGGFVNPKIQMWNVLGEAISTETDFLNGQITVHTQFLSNGFYVVRVSDGGKSYLKKVIVFR